MSDNKEYLVCDKNGEVFDWVLDGIMDYLDGIDPDLGTAIGKHMLQAEKEGKLVPKEGS